MIFKACRTILILPLVIFLAACNGSKKSESNNEVVYHVFLRSFYDANGDGHGDLKGLQEKLNYLEDLGITSILLTPINSSLYYHNYFSDDFKKIDPEFGDLQSFTDLAKDIHERGMKLYMDMETQYITEDHIWWKDSYGNPSSQYSDFIIYNGKGNTDPESIIFNLTELPGFDSTKRKVATVNLNSKKVLEYNYELFKYWMDPNGNGNFDDGVDGFRLDHAMDDLDYKGKLKNLYANFWRPLIERLKKVNPKLMIVAEQANWGDFGKEYFDKAGVDRVFAFRLQRPILTFDKKMIEKMMDSVFAITPQGKQQMVFIENHDMARSATVLKKDNVKEKIAAAVMLTIGGIPSIYYGQELGMPGVGGLGKWGMTDANDIPQREAFEWYADDSTKGMALWYKNTGPWWDSTNLKPNDGISLQEEKGDSSSLYNFYRTILQLRKIHPALVEGDFLPVPNDSEHLLTFLRTSKDEQLLIAINLSPEYHTVNIDINKVNIKELSVWSIFPTGKNDKTFSPKMNFDGYSFYIWKVK
jgi:glycosidase